MKTAYSIAFLLSLATVCLAAAPDDSPFAGEYSNSWFVGTTLHISISKHGSIVGRSVSNNRVELRGSIADDGSMTVEWRDGVTDSGRAELRAWQFGTYLAFAGIRTSSTYSRAISYEWYGR